MADDIMAPHEESLDPENWDELAQLGRRMVDDMMGYLKTVRNRPVWQATPESAKTELDRPLPMEPEGAAAAYQSFTQNVLPYPMGNIHPRFWAWVIGSGEPVAMLADMLASGMNPNAGGGEHAANYVEMQTLRWCKEMVGYPAESSGLLVSGGSAANLVGLTVARNALAGFDVRAQGLSGATCRLMVYGSVETHSSVQKAVEILGLGSDSFRRISVDDHYRINCEELENRIDEDIKNGHKPICVVGNAGTTNTGAIDNLEALATICKTRELWFHVDGAFGALAALSPGLKHLVSGMELADSLAFDLHKWMFLPYDIGCALVRNPSAHHNAFSLTPAYLSHSERGLAGGSAWFSDYGPELSRSFRALKAWMSIKTHGAEKFGRIINQNVEQAKYLERLVAADPSLQLLAPTSLNIVCFRFVSDSLDDEALNELNRELLLRLYESGIAAPSYTTLNGLYALRVAITNHRSVRKDFDALIKEVCSIGQRLASEAK